MINLVKLVKEDKSLGIFIKTKEGYKEVEIVDKVVKFDKVIEIPVSMDFSTGEIRVEKRGASYIN